MNSKSVLKKRIKKTNFKIKKKNISNKKFRKNYKSKKVPKVQKFNPVQLKILKKHANKLNIQMRSIFKFLDRIFYNIMPKFQSGFIKLLQNIDTKKVIKGLKSNYGVKKIPNNILKVINKIEKLKNSKIQNSDKKIINEITQLYTKFKKGVLTKRPPKISKVGKNLIFYVGGIPKKVPIEQLENLTKNKETFNKLSTIRNGLALYKSKLQLNSRLKEFRKESNSVQKQIHKKMNKNSKIRNNRKNIRKNRKNIHKIRNNLKTNKFGFDKNLSKRSSSFGKKFGNNSSKKFGSGSGPGFFGKIKNFFIGSEVDQSKPDTFDKQLLLKSKKYNTLGHKESEVSKLTNVYADSDSDAGSEPEYKGETKDNLGFYKIRKGVKKMGGILGRLVTLITKLFQFFILYPLLLIMDIMTYVELFLFRIPLFIIFSIIFLFIPGIGLFVLIPIMFFGTFLEYVPIIGPIALFVNLFISFAVELLVFLPDLILTFIDFGLTFGSGLYTLIMLLTSQAGLAGCAGLGVGCLVDVLTTALWGGGGSAAGGSVMWAIGLILGTLQLILGLPSFVISIFQTDFIGVIMGILEIVMYVLGLIPVVDSGGDTGSVGTQSARGILSPMKIIFKIGKLIKAIFTNIRKWPGYIAKGAKNVQKFAKSGKMLKTTFKGISKGGQIINKTIKGSGVKQANKVQDSIQNFKNLSKTQKAMKIANKTNEGLETVMDPINKVGTVASIATGGKVGSLAMQAVDVYGAGQDAVDNTKYEMESGKLSGIGGIKDSATEKMFKLGSKIVRLAKSFPRYISYILKFTEKYTITRPFSLFFGKIFNGLVAVLKSWKPGQSMLNRIALFTKHSPKPGTSFGKKYKKSINKLEKSTKFGKSYKKRSKKNLKILKNNKKSKKFSKSSKNIKLKKKINVKK